MDHDAEISALRAALAATERERDLYRKLLDLDATEEVEPFLAQALGLIVDLAAARRGYIEIRAEADGEDAAPFWMAHGCYDAEIEEIREEISRGIIAEAIATGRTIALESAISHPQFRRRGSVRRNQIEAVMCAPVGSDPPAGVVYLQDRIAAGPFTEEDRIRVETFARHVGAIADRLLLRRRTAERSDPTRELRRRLRVDGIIGESEAIAGVLSQVALVAPLDVAVLLTGESGTGKTQVARAIHDNSPRRSGPFVEINCAALPETLIESELFGALPGAHSTASRRVDGKVAAAEGGTLFLDEIAELRPPMQAKLLQFLQSREYYPLGGTRPIRANVRLVAASNVDLEAAVAGKEMRKDLYYRLQVLSIRLPLLAERRGDVPLLVRHFCERAAAVHGLPRLSVSRGALRAAEASEWPGNVRQLAHAVEAAAIRAAGEGALEVEARHLFSAAPAAAPSAAPASFQQATRQFQRDLIRRTLESTGWNIAEAASRLDVARSHVYNLIRAFGLERSA